MSYTPRQSVIVKTPLRVTLGGGGTDLPFYASERGGFLISAAIDEYISVSVASRPLDEMILIQTTTTKFCNSLEEVHIPILKETLRYFDRTHAIQVATFSTLPTGIGLGSSSTQVVGLAKALATLNGKSMTPMELAAAAYEVERDILGHAGGVQDQYIAALGGIQILRIDTSGKVTAEPVLIEDDVRERLERKLVLVYSGRKRDSNGVIKSQEVDIDKKLMVYDEIKKIGMESVDLLKKADIKALGEAMDDHWNLKRQLSNKISDDDFDRQYEELKSFGATGGKLMGAGGGGFFIMAVPGDETDYIMRIYEKGYRALEWCFEFEGSHVIQQVACPSPGRLS